MAPKRAWHLDFKVTLGLILTTVLQIGLGIAWAVTIRNTVTEHEKSLVRIEARQDRTDTAILSQIDRLARIEANLSNLTELTRQIQQYQMGRK